MLAHAHRFFFRAEVAFYPTGNFKHYLGRSTNKGIVTLIQRTKKMSGIIIEFNGIAYNVSLFN